jgi:hypothetical protein
MKYRLLSILIPAMYLLCGCSSNEELSFQEAKGEAFPYESPITAVTDAGDSLLLGTSRGDIVSFNLSDGSFSHVYHDPQGRFVYNIVKCDDGSLIYSVQNGGVIHLALDGKTTVYVIGPGKGSNYSAYGIIHKDDAIYASTSNGVYHWIMSEELFKDRLDSVIQTDQGDIVASRFYSIQYSDSCFVCAGEAGLYSFTSNGRAQKLGEGSLYSAEGNLSLTRDGRLLKDGTPFAALSIPALDFVKDDSHIYAVSLSAIEVIDSSNGQHVATISLPDERGAEKNVSCRAFCLIKDDYLYVAPSGCALYRMPLYKHISDSEEVVQICTNGGTSAYLITKNNDLYRFTLGESEVDYRRSFEPSADVKLVAAYGDVLLVTIDGKYYELSGRRLTDEMFLSDLNGRAKAKVLWYVLDGDKLYQGHVDKIRVYDGSAGWRLCQEFEKGDDMGEDINGADYYPQRAAVYIDGMIVNTMHYGTFFLDTDGFDKLKEFDGLVVKDIEAYRNRAYVLCDDKVVYRTAAADTFNIRFSNPEYKHFNEIVPFDDGALLAYSTYNRWGRGGVIFQETEGGKWVASRHLSAHDVNVAERFGNVVLAGGTMGLSLISPEGNITTVSVPEPTFFQKNVLAWNYPWGIVIYVTAMLVVLAVIVWCIIVFRRYYLKYRCAKIYDSFYKWVTSEYEGKYVRSLAKQVKPISPDRRRLKENVALFKTSSTQLHELEALMQEFSDLYDKVKKLSPLDMEKGNMECIRELKDKLEIFCKEDHPFGNTIIKLWGKSTVQPIRTMMLLPMKFKIKYMQIFDSRTGAEKMDFKSFMEQNKASILDRNLEIRDLIALSAYHAIISEKAPVDA